MRLGCCCGSNHFGGMNWPSARSEVVYGNVDRPELRLITCAGAFNQAERSYEQNAVVFAHLR